MDERISVAALLTCHNRREATLACLEALHAQQLDPSVELTIYLVDDGSTDGTGQAVRDNWPNVRLLQGDGDLYWNGGMRVAFASALRKGHDAYLWVNDDTVLDKDALPRMLALSREWEDKGSAAIFVGATRDPTAPLVTTYTGVTRRDRLRPMRFTPVEPTETAQECETMNGNCVLIPATVANHLGNLDASFRHAMGDFDYGLRAQRAGLPVILAPGHVGVCTRNPGRPKPARRGLDAVWHTWRAMANVKGLPPRDWLAFTRRWAGPAWPVYWLSPYLRQLGRALVGRR